MKRALGMLLALAACGGSSPLVVEADRSAQGLMPHWAYSSGLQERGRDAVAIMARVWGGEMSASDGWTVTVRPGAMTCAGELATGCTRPGEQRIDIDPRITFCIEETALAHEVGHLLGYTHADPRFCDRAFWDRMFAALQDLGCVSDPENFYWMNVACGR